MRYFVTFASGEERVVRFETTATGLVAHVENGDELRSMTFDYAILEQGKALNLIVGDESHDFYLGPRNGGYEVHYRGAVVPVDIVDERERGQPVGEVLVPGRHCVAGGDGGRLRDS